MRGLLLIIIPALLLLGLNAALPALQNWRYIPTAPAGEVMYAAGFDGLLDEWDQFEDGERRAQIDGGVLRLTIEGGADSAFSNTRLSFADFDLYVQARAVGGPLNNAFGVMFRLQDQENRDIFDDSFYLFLISSDGYTYLSRVIGGQERILSTWIENDAVQTGMDAVNGLRVVGRGSAFQFFVNDQPVLLCIPNNPDGQSTYFGGECIDGQMRDTLTDATLASGHVGLVVRRIDEPGVEVTFDNLLVFAPQES